jgi:hypothetical protein
MYHAIVKRRVESLFAAINDGNAEPVIEAFGPAFQHIFLGTSALGGQRSSITRTREWYARLFRLLPDLHFDLRSIQVAGPPWNTIVLAEWDETNSGTDGVRTYNRGIHVLHLSWGKATKLIICPDTVGLQATLDRLARASHPDAHAPMIED